jgi:DNA end-binding protein Ku
MIIDKRSGRFNPEAFHDRYQDALRALVEAKAKGRKLPPPQVKAPAKVVDLMDALKRSLAESPKLVEHATPAKASKSKKKADPRQRHLLLPVSGHKEPARPARRKSTGKTRKSA